MKNLIIFLLAVSPVFSFAQLPVQSPSEFGYSKSNVLEFTQDTTELSAQYRSAFVDLINKGFRESGSANQIAEEHISWALDSVREEYVELDTFLVSRVIENTLEFQETYSHKGVAGVFYFGDLRVVLYLRSSISLLDVIKEGKRVPTFLAGPTKPAYDADSLAKAIDEQVEARVKEEADKLAKEPMVRVYPVTYVYDARGKLKSRVYQQGMDPQDNWTNKVYYLVPASEVGAGEDYSYDTHWEDNFIPNASVVGYSSF